VASFEVIYRNLKGKFEKNYEVTVKEYRVAGICKTG